MKNFYIKVIEHALSFKEPFTVDGFFNKDLEITNDEKKVVESHFKNAHINARKTQTLGEDANTETIFMLSGKRSHNFSDETNKYTLSFDAHFKYLDYRELKLAQENAERARRYSLLAISISVLTIIISILIPILVTQDVRIDNEQFNNIRENLTK